MRIFRSTLPPRRFHAYGVGTAKSGTHSLAAIFGAHRSAHEPDSRKTINAILKLDRGASADGAIERYLVRRDKKLQLEMDSSQLNYFFSTHLARLFPQAKFVLTIRDCYTWLDSFINHQLSRPASRDWVAMRDLRFLRGDAVHSAEEKILAEHRLYTLDGYLSYWAEHNRNVLDLIPRGRLLVVRTDRLAQSIGTLAQFLDVESGTLDRQNSHTFKAAQKFGFLHKLDDEYLDAKVAQHCRDLMRAYFPEIASVRDAPLH
jgi:hypothetical protein